MKIISKKFLRDNNIKWEPTNKVEKVGYTKRIWCVCECGIEKWIWLQNLKQLKSKSCKSCASKIHGGSNTRLNNIWKSMKHRCSPKKR